MPAAALEVEDLCAGYGPTPILEHISLSLPAGRRLAVLGRNGVGKTTLLRSLVGQTRRFGGRIWLGGAEVTHQSSAVRAAAGLGYVPQTRDIFASLTVHENLSVGLKGSPASAIEEAYRMFPRLRDRRNNLGGRLSGGEQQMLATARTLLGRPSVLLLDEPLEGLSPTLCAELMTVFTRLAAERSTTTVLVEQRIGVALDFADTAIILERGRIAWSGPASALRDDPAILERLVGLAGRVGDGSTVH